MGWTPVERHEHYDADDNLTGYTVVTREPEWDDTSRDELLALARYELEVHSCGYHSSLTHDPANVFMPTEDTCPVCKGRDAFARIQHDADQKAEKAAGDDPRKSRPGDGRTTYMRLLPPDEAEAVKQRRAVTRGDTPGTGSPRA